MYLGYPFKNLLWISGLESAAIAFTAWVAGTLVGLALGWVLIYVINVQSFGWTLFWDLPIEASILFGFFLVISALFGGLIVGLCWHKR